jgi:hypothetical protein
MTRALSALLHGDFAAAWRLHPLSPAALSVLAGIGGGAFLELLGYALRLPWRHPAFWGGAAILVTAFGILRIVVVTL